MNPPAFTKPRPGIAFKNGKFYAFDTNRIVVMRAWPDPMAWYRTPKRPWRGTRKWADEHLISCFANLQEPADRPPPLDQFSLKPDRIAELQEEGAGTDALEHFRVCEWRSLERDWKDQTTCIRPFIGQIPAEIQPLIAPLRYRAWHLLGMFARCPGAADLYQSNPALAYALSGHWLYREHPVQNTWRATRALVRKRQRDILAWMGFPGTKSVQHIFRKVQINRLHPATLRTMKNALLDPVRHKTLAHLPVIKPEVLALINNADLFYRVSRRFLIELSGDDVPASAIYRILKDTLRMNRMVGGDRLPACFHSINRLHEAHEALTVDTNRLMLTRRLHFPPPPYAGTAAIQPLATLQELVREGVLMQHCVASYADLVAGGCHYVYRVLKPVRATLAIKWIKNSWHATELQGCRNALISAGDRAEITSSFFEGTCLRGPIARPPDPVIDAHEDGAADLMEPVGADTEPEPWVPCDEHGHPVLLFSEESRALMQNFHAIFAG